METIISCYESGSCDFYIMIGSLISALLAFFSSWCSCKSANYSKENVLLIVEDKISSILKELASVLREITISPKIDIDEKRKYFKESEEYTKKLEKEEEIRNNTQAHIRILEIKISAFCHYDKKVEKILNDWCTNSIRYITYNISQQNNLTIEKRNEIFHDCLTLYETLCEEIKHYYKKHYRIKNKII